jgi:ribosomal protein S8E
MKKVNFEKEGEIILSGKYYFQNRPTNVCFSFVTVTSKHKKRCFNLKNHSFSTQEKKESKRKKMQAVTNKINSSKFYQTNFLSLVCRLFCLFASLR